MHCPGSVLASRGVEGPQTEYAAEGVASHSLSEWAREQQLPVANWKGVTIQVGEFSFKVGKAMIDGVQTFVDACAREPGDPYYEVMVHYEPWVPGGFGTADDIRIADGLCTVTDLKFGRGVKVFAKDNAQLKLYALGAFLTYGWMYEFDKFVLKINQPRLHHFEEFRLSLGELMQWAYDEVRPAAKLALTPQAPLRAGNWCKFCKIKEGCPVRAKWKIMQSTGSADEYTSLD